ncbi:MAG: hypothetical protein ACRBB2_06480 [Nitrosopumilus sp.]
MNPRNEAHETWGACDIVAEVNSDDAESLFETITWKIRKISSIRATINLMTTEEEDWEKGCQKPLF